MNKKVLTVLLALTLVLTFSFTALADADKDQLQDLHNYTLANFTSYTSYGLIFLSDMIDWVYDYVPAVLNNADATQELVNSTYNDFLQLIKSGTGSYPPGFEPIVKPVYHTVTFTDWDGAVLDEQQVEHGVAAIAPADPQREGYSFIGWDVDFSAVSGDLVVTAQYEINTYTVGFRVFDGYWSIGYSQQVKQGESIDWAAVESEYPFYNGKTWADVELWCNDASGNPLWDLNQPITEDLVLYPKFHEIKTYTVGFRVFDGYWSIGYSQQVKQGESIDWAEVESEYPFYNGKTWVDVELWCDDASGNPLWNLNQPITEDLMLFPKFYEVQEPEPELVSVNPTASVKKLNGNKNDLTITVIEEYSDGSKVVFAETFSISNNATGTYNVGSYKVYVDTKGNDQIRACYLVE